MKRKSALPTPLRVVLAGFAGGLAWIVAMMILFGPAQAILANPDYQSEKFLVVFGQLEPLPHTAGAMWILAIGLLAIGMVYGVVYHFIRNALARRTWWIKGLRFGAVTWAIMVPWFEFYLPWNVMHEPLPLVLLEAVLWLGVLLLVGIAIAGVYEWGLMEASD